MKRRASLLLAAELAAFAVFCALRFGFASSPYRSWVATASLAREANDKRAVLETTFKG